jgi:hypothetical protein
MPYELPRAIHARLAAAARGLRNADAAMRLAAFLARFHTAPGRLGRTFPVDRIALAAHAELGLSASRIRGALAALEQIGFLERHELPGSRYRRTEWGLRRKPVLWRFAATFFAIFESANRIALGKRLSAARRMIPQPAPLLARKYAYRGDLFSGDQPRPKPDEGLEAALSRLRAAVAGGP